MFTYKVNDSIGPFTVVSLIKEGAYAESYKVQAPSGTCYFLKLLVYDKMGPAQFDENNDPVELIVSKKLKSDDLLKLHGYGGFKVDDIKYAYIVYDFIDGKTMPECLPMEESTRTFMAVKVVGDVLSGLNYLYSQKPIVLHNNITLDNIMLCADNDKFIAKLIDFGHAKFETQDYSFFEHEGDSIFYLAPESFNGVSTIQSDLYSVGVVLYALLFGELPFAKAVSTGNSQEDFKESVYERKRDYLDIPATLPKGMKKEMVNVVRKALSFEPADRFSTPDEFRTALSDAVRGISTAAAFTKAATTGRGTGFDAIAGMNSLKERLQNDVIDVLKDADRAKALGIDIPNGLLLYGPPGCGKTFFAEKFAEELGCNYMYIKCSDVASPYIHGGQEKIAKVFDEAREKAPTVLFLDEIEAMLTDREVRRTVSEAGEVNEFLAQMNNCGKDGVLVIGASNHPLNIDKAALRAGRLELHYYIANPDLEARKALFRINLRRRAVKGEINIDSLAERTEGYASVDIKAIVDNAGRYVFKNKGDAITMSDLDYALGQTKSSLTAAQIKEFERIRDVFENKSTRTRIGF